MEKTIFHKPLRWQTSDGDERKVGFELEFAGIDIKKCTTLVAEHFGGEVHFNHSLQAEIKGSHLGTFVVELDSRLLREMAKTLHTEPGGEFPGKEEIYSLLRDANRWANEIFKTVVPLEIVSPPLNFEHFHDLEALRRLLRMNQAEGTKKKLTNAFGLHINPELPSHDPDVIVNYLRAFFVLYPWLLKELDVDVSRRLLTFISPYPNDYVKLVLKEEYSPNLDQFIEDYLSYSSTRNRALDLLPLIAHLKPEAIKKLSKKEQELVKPRPTLHYRLPNCNIDDPNWTIAKEWNAWAVVDDLAFNTDMLMDLSDRYRHYLKSPVDWLFKSWHKVIDKELS